MERTETGAAAWQALLEAGRAIPAAWVKDGLLVASSTLAETWGSTPDELELATRQGELVAIEVGGQTYHPAAFGALPAEAVRAVCGKLAGDDTAAKCIFWWRTHGALGGHTLADAIKAGRLAKVVQLADGWSAERGLSTGPRIPRPASK